MKHLTEAESFELIDGGLPANRAERLEGHLQRCSDCRRELDELRQMAADLAFAPELDEAAHARDVMARLDERRAPAASPPDRRRVAAFRVAAALAAAAVVLLAVGLRHRERADVPPEFAARGSTAPAQERSVGVRLLTGTKSLEPVTEGRALAASAAFTAAYWSVGRARALVFAVDSAQTVHWLYPAYTNADDDPESIVLEPTKLERPLPTSVVLDQPAPGPMRFVSVITDRPIHVSAIERRPSALLGRDALERDFDARVTEIRVEILP